MSKVTFAFPGQGAQKRGMLTEEMAKAFPDLIRAADDILGYSLLTLCGPDGGRNLDRTEFTQPALFVVNALSYLQRLRQTGREPDFAIGHSLGEYNALFAAGAFDFETGLRLVQRRGQTMSRVTGGAMAVVIGLPVETISRLIDENGLAIDLANLNAPLQTTLAGLRAEIERARPIFDGAGGRWIMLNVSGPFHSRHMTAAAEEYRAFLSGFPLCEPRFPVISNVTAAPHAQARMADDLARHLTEPVRWCDGIRHLLQAGCGVFEEIGPAKILSPLIRDIRQDTPPPDIGAERPAITAESLGCPEFRRDYGVKYAYLAGSMYKGISSEDLVVRMGKAGLLAFFGTGGLDLGRIEDAILAIRRRLGKGRTFGMNLLSNPAQPLHELAMVDLFLRHGVDTVEASGSMQITPAVVKYRLAGLRRGPEGSAVAGNRIIAKVSRPEIGRLFLSPAPEAIVAALLEQRQVTADQARLSRLVALADDLCVEADSAGHTDRGSAVTLLPAFLRLRDDSMRIHSYRKRIRVGLAGGIGTPEAAAAAFVMGADFILTGSINQCTVDAGLSDAAKDLLEQMDVQDTDYAPAGDMFEIGSQVQVLKKGVFFPARANKLYELYRNHDSVNDIDSRTIRHIEEKYFRRSLDEVYAETKEYWSRVRPAEIERAERDPKHKMVLLFKWYFVHSMRLALQGCTEQPLDYQIHCSPALGAFNKWVKDTPLQPWKARHADIIAETLMTETAAVLNASYARLARRHEASIPGRPIMGFGVMARS